jgi:hypothetical protein
VSLRYFRDSVMCDLKGWRDGGGAGARIVVGSSRSVGGIGESIVPTGVSLTLSPSLWTVAKSFTAV